MKGIHGGCLLAKVVVWVKIRDYKSDNTGRLVAGVQMLPTVNLGHLCDQHGLIIVPMREDAPGFTIVDRGTIFGLAYLIQVEDEGDRITIKIALRTLHEVY